MKEGYGDPHLHHTGYPGSQYPHSCGDSSPHKAHGNMCTEPENQVPGVAYKNGHAYDCSCNLCQAPWSLPYHPGPGGHMGGLQEHRPCGNAHCRCADCDGNCKCGAGNMVEGFNVGGQDMSMMYFLMLLAIAFAVYYFVLRKK